MKTYLKFHTVLFLILIIALIHPAKATHNRSGEIRYQRIAPFSNYTYSITIVKYFDVGSSIADRCVDSVYFGDGGSGIANRINGTGGSCCSTSSCGVLIVNESSYKVKMSVYSIVHTYSGPGTYVIYSSDPNRSPAINNFPNSATTPFYVEAQVLVSPSLVTNSSPLLLRAPIDRGFVNTPYYHNACAIDDDGDSLSYELIACRALNQSTVAGYSLPPTSPNGSIFMHPITGLLTWDSPPLQGKYQVAIVIKEWRRLGCLNYQQIGYVERDMEIIVGANTALNTFTAAALADVCMPAGTQLSQTLTSLNQSNGIMTCEIIGSNNANVNAATISYTNQSLGNTLNTYVTYTSNCAQAKNYLQYLYLVYTYTNLPVPQTFYTQYRLKVIPPAPQITGVQIGTGSITVQWLPPLSCNSALGGYKIYRKLGSTTWTAGSCDVAAPAASGYSYVGSTSGSNGTYTDINLVGIPIGTPINYLVNAVWTDCTEGYAAQTGSVNVAVGLTEYSEARTIGIWPNPFRESVKVRLDGLGIKSIEATIYSMDGKKCMTKQVVGSNSVFEIETSELSAGLYLLSLRSAETTWHMRLVKEE
jgi:hypothetical protein